jgi:endonuclease/exonuclease/phosphatase family metal-dependent hydrolase
MVTWGLLEFTEIQQRLIHLNTHFPYRSEEHQARLWSAELLRRHIANLPPRVPLFLTGDFNAPSGGEVYEGLHVVLRDAWLSAKLRRGPEYTFHGFTGHLSDSRIDWILYRGEVLVREAVTVTQRNNGRFPSDHYPVVAAFEFWPGSRASDDWDAEPLRIPVLE